MSGGLLQGLPMDGALGVPGMVGDLLLGDRLSAAAQRRSLIAGRASLALSNCRAAESLAQLAQLELTTDGVVLRAPGAFLLRLRFETVWLVAGFKLEPQGLGALMSLPDEALLCQQLQAVADESKTLRKRLEKT